MRPAAEVRLPGLAVYAAAPPAGIIYAIGPNGKAVLSELEPGEDLEDARRRLQLLECMDALCERRDSQTVYVWEPLKTDKIDTQTLRRL